MKISRLMQRVASQRRNPFLRRRETNMQKSNPMLACTTSATPHGVLALQISLEILGFLHGDRAQSHRIRLVETVNFDRTLAEDSFNGC
jgi:hypothetical protein